MSAKENEIYNLAKTGAHNDSDLFEEKTLESVRRDLNHARHLPGYFYSDPDIYQLEIEKFFMKDWLVVGRVEEFPNSGDYRAMELAGENIIYAAIGIMSSTLFQMSVAIVARRLCLTATETRLDSLVRITGGHMIWTES